MSISIELLNEIYEIGLFNSINVLVKLNKDPILVHRLYQAMSMYEIGLIDDGIRLISDMNIDLFGEKMHKSLFLEVSLKLFIKKSRVDRIVNIINDPFIMSEFFSFKIDYLLIQALMICYSQPDSNHPAKPFLLRLFDRYPFSVEICEMMLKCGISINDSKITEIGQPYTDFINGIISFNQQNYRFSMQCFNNILLSYPGCIPALNKLAICAQKIEDDSLFDSCVSQLPFSDPEIIDMRAYRLKHLNKQKELEFLVVEALNSSQASCNNWLALSYHFELCNDHQRAFHSVTHSLNLDKNSRRAYMRQGELRIKRNDVRKAEQSFSKAHVLLPGIDSFTALVHCNCLLKNWDIAKAYASAAMKEYPEGSFDCNSAVTLMGLALRGNDRKRAISILNTVISRDKTNIEALGALIDIKIEDEDYNSALELLEATRTPKNEFFFCFKTGELYGYMKDYEKSMEFIQKALNINPNNERAKSMLEQLESFLDNTAD